MRILPAALAISAVLHTGALAWVYARRMAEPAKSQRARAVSEPEAAPIEVEVLPATVALLDDHTVATIPRMPSPAGHTGGARTPARPGTGRISTGHAPGPEVGPETTAPPAHSPLMTMRQPEPKGLSDEFTARFLANTKPLQPKAIEGERIADDLAHDEEHLNDPRWIANASPEEVTAQRGKLLADREAAAQHELKPDGTGMKAEHSGFDAKVSADGTVKLHDKPTFDATDALMRAHGMDPYASYKLKILDETREERYQIGKRHNHEVLMRSAQLAQKNIDDLWAKTTDLAARKEGLFELWDDCLEAGDDDQVFGGRAARVVIVGTIRARLTGSAAYTANELARLNARKKSRAPFDPYAE